MRGSPVGVPSSSYSSLHFGDVVFDEGRHWIVISCDRYNADTNCPSVFVARGTRHSKDESLPAVGEMPVLYPDDRSPKLFPNEFRFNYSFFQIHGIRPLLKANSMHSTKRRFLGHCYPPCLESVRAQLQSLWCGYRGALPKRKPNRDPLFSRIKRGVTVQVSGGIPYPHCLVLSDETVHEWYPLDDMIIVPILDAKAERLEEKYFLRGLHGMNTHYAKVDYEKRFSPNSKFQIDVKSVRTPTSEVEQLLHRFRLIFGIEQFNE
jgi:hypothetical protein